MKAFLLYLAISVFSILILMVPGAKAELVGIPKPGVGWVEVQIPFVDQMEFDDELEVEKNSSGGLGITGAWTPLTKLIKKDDKFIVKLLKSVGVTANMEMYKGANFNNYLYTVEDYRSDWQCEQGFSDCSTCYYEPFYGYHGGYNCSYNVYGRDTYVKYVNGSVAIGMYVPIQIMKKVTVSAGTNLRLFLVSEGIQTDGLRSSYETGFTAVVRVGYNFNDRWSTNASYEQALSGYFKEFRRVAIGVTYRF